MAKRKKPTTLLAQLRRDARRNNIWAVKRHMGKKWTLVIVHRIKYEGVYFPKVEQAWTRNTSLTTANPAVFDSEREAYVKIKLSPELYTWR